MKLKLQNFKCFVEFEIDLPDSGLNLLSAPNGKGKTTVFQAIVYALYGKCKKPCTRGTTTCRVDLEILDLSITRTTHPNRLLVISDDVEYEDDAGQGIIESTLGVTYDEFVAASYVRQNKKFPMSLLSMTPSDQIKFIEKLALSDDKHIQNKEKLKFALHQLEEENSVKSGEINVLEKNLEEKKAKFIEEIEEPELDREELLDDLLKRQETVNSLEDRITIIRDDLDSLRDSSKIHKELEEQIQKLSIEISQLQSLKSDLPVEISKDEIQVLEEKQKLLQYRTSRTKTYNLYEEEKRKVDSLIDGYCNEIKQKLEILKPTILDKKRISVLKEKEKKLLSSQIQDNVLKSEKEKAKGELLKILKDSSEYLSTTPKNAKELETVLVKKIKEVKQKIVDINRKCEKLTEVAATSKLSNYIYSCPSCKCDIVFREGDIKLYEEGDSPDETDHDTEISNNKQELESLNSLLSILETHSNSVKEINRVLSKNSNDSENDENLESIRKSLLLSEQSKTEYDDLMTKLETNFLPPSILKLSKKVEDMKNEISDFEPEESVENLEEQLLSISNDLGSAMATISDHSGFARDITLKEQKLKSLKKRVPNKKSSHEVIISLETELSSLTLEMSDTTKRITEILSGIEKVKKYEEYIGHREEVDKLETDLSCVMQELQETEERVSGIMQLEELSKQAEILALDSTVESINEHAKIYLDTMFEESISIRLENVKKNKGKGKLSIGLNVEYKGSNTDDIEELSGGELQKAELAFVLGCNDMVGGKLLFFDECFNNIDGEMHSEILNYVKEICGDKNVFIVSHESIEGVFDNVKRIGQEE